MIDLFAVLLPRAGKEIVPVLRALDEAGFVEGPPAADPAQLARLPDHEVVRWLVEEPAPGYDALAGLFERASSGEGVAYLYTRWVAPLAWPEALRAEAEAACGPLLGPSDPRAPFDPLQLIVPIDLADTTGATRARAFARHEAYEVRGIAGAKKLLPSKRPTELDLAYLCELRVMDAMLPFATWALARVGDGPAYLSPIELW